MNEYMYLFDRCYIERDEDGKPLRMTGSMMDITDRKRSEEQLMESEQRLRLSMEAAKQGLYDLNIKTGQAIVNEQYALMLEYDPGILTKTMIYGWSGCIRMTCLPRKKHLRIIFQGLRQSTGSNSDNVHVPVNGNGFYLLEKFWSMMSRAMPSVCSEHIRI